MYVARSVHGQGDRVLCMVDYRLNDPRQGLIGPVRLETVRDLLDAGVIFEDVLVSKDDGPFLPIRAHAELTGPLAAKESPRPVFAGDLGKHTFFKVFYRLHRSQANGCMVVKCAQRRKDVYMEGGETVYVSSNHPQERLGRFLIRQRVIDEHELQVGLDSMHSDGNRLGRTLVRLGIMDAKGLFQELQQQQVERLQELCLWENGRYLFFKDMICQYEKTDLRFDTGDLVLNAARSMPISVMMKRLHPHVRARAHRIPHSFLDQGRLCFSAEEQTVLDHLAQGDTIEGVLRRFEPMGKVALTVVYMLWEIDALGFDSP